MTTDLVVREPATPDRVFDLMETALASGKVEDLERLVALHERMTALQAARDFASALAEFQAACPPVPKSSHAKIVTKGGTSYGYDYAELDAIARHVGPELHRHGFSYAWDSELRDGYLRCVCTLRHANGHAATATFTAPVASPSAMSDQQKHAAALTYARRQSLVSVLGITTGEPDPDGAPAGPTLTDEQVVEIEEMLELGKVDAGKFRAFLGVERLHEIPASRFDEVKGILKRKMAHA